MKKFILAAALCACIATTANAQVKFGVKGGLNVTSLSLSSDVIDKSNRTGFFIGPTVKFSLPVVGLGVDAAALYDQRSAKVEDAGGETTVKQQQIAIPVNLRYSIGLGSTANLFFFAGPQFGFNIGDKEKDFGISEWRFKSAHVSLNVGAGVFLLSHLQASVNYNIALSKSAEITYANVVDAYKAKTNAWQIGLAYYF